MLLEVRDILDYASEAIDEREAERAQHHLERANNWIVYLLEKLETTPASVAPADDRGN